jgi:ABC-type transporter Mla subunit MlaD
MTSTTKARRTTKSTKVPAALHIPLAVLAQMPEKLRLLGETIKAASKTIKGTNEEFRAAHNKVRSAYDDANGTANCVVNSLEQLGELVTAELSAVVKGARAARNLTGAIYKVSSNIHNDDCFKRTFDDLVTVEATVAALNGCGDEIRAAIRKFGY